MSDFPEFGGIAPPQPVKLSGGEVPKPQPYLERYEQSLNTMRDLNQELDSVIAKLERKLTAVSPPVANTIPGGTVAKTVPTLENLMNYLHSQEDKLSRSVSRLGKLVDQI